MTDNKTIIVATGGTGGHIFPADSLALELVNRGYNVIMLVDEKYKKYGGFDKGKIIEIKSSSISGGVFSKISKLFNVTKAVFQAAIILFKLKPKLVIGFGGYPSFPPCMAAMLMNMSYMIHEQNSVLGLANQILSLRAKKIATSFKDTAGISTKYLAKVIYTGNPVRESIRKMSNLPYSVFNKRKILTITIIGGSQGASIFSRVIPEALISLPLKYRKRLKIVQQCRSSEINQVKEKYDLAKIDAEIDSFFSDIPEKFTNSHLVIARSGASTIAELLSIKRPAILVPLANSARNHQYVNAQRVSEQGVAIIMQENIDFTEETLSQQIISFFEDPKLLVSMQQKIAAESGIDSAGALADVVAAT